MVDHRADEGYVTPAEVVGEDAVYISRIRKDRSVANGLSMWVVADNLRKGAALNAVQIAEILVRDYLSGFGEPVKAAAPTVEPQSVRGKIEVNIRVPEQEIRVEQHNGFLALLP